MKISKPTNHKWSILGRGGVNYQMQIVIKLPNGTIKVAQNDSEQQILPNSHFSNLYQL